MQIILASGSKYKRQLIEKLGLSVIAHNADIDESEQDSEQPETLARRLSLAKARAIAPLYPKHLIIGADQVADLNGQRLGKPGTLGRAKEQLLACSGRKVRFHTGVCLLNADTGNTHYAHSLYEVQFRSLTRAQIDFYLQAEMPLDCAGSFKSEGLGIALFDSIRGDDPNSLIGLPLIELTKLLLKEGIDVLCPTISDQD